MAEFRMCLGRSSIDTKKVILTMKRMQGKISILALAAVVVMAGCNEGESSEATKSNEAQKTTKNASHTMVIPAGTSVVVELDSRLTTDKNVTGDRFAATTTEPIVVGGMTVIPAGARIEGVLQDVEASGRVKGRARMTLAYQRVVDSKGTAHAISAAPLKLQAASEKTSDVEKIAAGTVLGGLIGGIAGGEKGALIGAGAGAGAGTVLMLATKGDEIELESGQKLIISMMGPVNIDMAAH